MLRGSATKLHTSVPVVIETFTFLERNANRDVALSWKDSILDLGTVKILPCDVRDLERSWEYFAPIFTSCRLSMLLASRS